MVNLLFSAGGSGQQKECICEREISLKRPFRKRVWSLIVIVSDLAVSTLSNLPPRHCPPTATLTAQFSVAGAASLTFIFFIDSFFVVFAASSPTFGGRNASVQRLPAGYEDLTVAEGSPFFSRPPRCF